MPEAADIGFTVRCLIRSARQASLATLADGAPFVSLVTPAAACGGDLLMLVSGLSRHARQLQRDGRCSMLISAEGPIRGEGPILGDRLVNGAEQKANPQTIPRVTLTGTAAAAPDPALRERWIRIHPYGALYAGFGDFSLWRLRPEQAYFVGGFGRAGSLPAPSLGPRWDASAEEARLLEAANLEHAASMPEARRIVALDADGVDIGPGPSMDPNGDARTERIAFPAPVGTPEAIRDAIAAIFYRSD